MLLPMLDERTPLDHRNRIQTIYSKRMNEQSNYYLDYFDHPPPHLHHQDSHSCQLTLHYDADVDYEEKTTMILVVMMTTKMLP
jgi:hypothetical protein